MNISRIKRWVSKLLILILLIVVGCSKQIQSTTQVPILTSATQTKTSFIKTPTLSSSPSPTATITPTRMASQTPLPTFTMTFQPTLESTQSFMAIQEFLSQGMDCQSPCFLGITPGQSTIDQAKNIFNWLRAPLWHAPDPAFYSANLNYEDGPSFTIKLEINNNIVKNMELGIDLTTNKGAANTYALQAFSPDALLNKYGSPSRVGLGLFFPAESGFPPKTAWYDMIMYFDTLDLIVYYYNGLTTDADLIRACPLTDHFENVMVYIGKDQRNPPSLQLPLEKATNLTLDLFSNLMTQKTAPACFDMSKKAFFPTP